MASRCRSVSKPATNLFRFGFSNPSSKPTLPNLHPHRPLISPRGFVQLGLVQSLLPLHSAVSAARLIACLGVGNSHSLCQGMACSDPGV